MSRWEPYQKQLFEDQHLYPARHLVPAADKPLTSAGDSNLLLLLDYAGHTQLSLHS